MVEEHSGDAAVNLLQELGLKEYEAKCFVGLSKLSSATAKQLNEISDVPRTRVYDAVRTLEAQGLVEIQHSSPQRFRAVPIEEAAETLSERYESRIDRLSEALAEARNTDAQADRRNQEVYHLSDPDEITNRICRAVSRARDEITLLICRDELLPDSLLDSIDDVHPTVTVHVGSGPDLPERWVCDSIPGADVFAAPEWLFEEVDGRFVGRLMLVDRSAVLVSSVDASGSEERATFCLGDVHGFVLIVRQILAQGMSSSSGSGSGRP